MNDFVVVDTESSCFLCLNPIKTGAKCPTNYSVQDLSQYLKLNRGKDGIPQELLDKVENARLKVQLCPMCGVLIGQFSKLFRQLEKVEMEIGDCLSHIQKRMEVAVAKTGVSCNSIGSLMGKEDIVEVQRSESEVTQKSSKRADTRRRRRPRAKLENPSLRKVKATVAKSKRKSKNRRTISKAVSIDKSGVDPDWNDCHSEEMDVVDHSEDCVEEAQDILISTSGQDTSNEASGNVQQPSKMNELIKNPAPVTVRKNFNLDKAIDGKLQSAINPETGNHKCSLCEKEFKHLESCQSHYKGAHLGEKYSCGLCGKEFIHKKSWYHHNKSIHLGVRFKCNGCETLFREKNALLKHLARSPWCKKVHAPNGEGKRKGASTSHDNASDSGQSNPVRHVIIITEQSS